MAESEKNKEKLSKWTVEEVRKLHQECPDDTKLVPYAKIFRAFRIIREMV